MRNLGTNERTLRLAIPPSYTTNSYNLAPEILYNANLPMSSFPQTKFQVAVLAESPDQIGGLRDSDSIEWLFCKRAGDLLFDFYRGDTLISSIDLERTRFDLQSLLGIIVVGSADTLDAIKNSWNSWLPAVELVFKLVPEGDSGAILSAALDCISEVLASQRCHSGRTALDLATYRREFERLQHNFVRLEEFVGRQSYKRPTEIFEYSPDSVSATEASSRTRLDNVADATGVLLTQYLPVDSLGLSSFSIHISAKPDASAEPLLVKLKAIETGHVFAAWSIPASDVRVGWVELALDHAIDDSALSITAIVEWPQTGGWALSLGPPHPYREFCARTGAGQYLGAPLGLRVFSSLPGVRVTPTTTAIRPMNASQVPAEFVPYEVYEDITQVSPRVRDGEATLVSYERDSGCITVHPGNSGLTIARMSIAVPKNAWGISAEIHLAHERANPTQFGLLACPSRDESKELSRLDHLEAGSRTFSGWKSLAALEKRSISLVLAPPVEERLSVYLVTRQDRELSPDFAWARFSKLAFNTLPVPLILDEANEPAPIAAEIVSSNKP